MRKKILIVIGIIGIGTLCSFALANGFDIHKGMHKHHDPEKMVMMKAQQLSELLDLTADQKTKVEEIGMKYAKEMKAAMKNAPNHEGMKAQMKETMGKIHTEIKAILTPEQIKIFDEIDFQAFHKEHHHGHMNMMHEKMHGLHEALKPDLVAKRIVFNPKLTDEEQSTIAEVRKVMPSMDEIHAKMAECKKSCMDNDSGDMEDIHAKMKAQFATKHEELSKLSEPLNAIVTNHKADLTIIFEEMKALAMERIGADLPDFAKKMMAKHGADHFEMMAKHFLLLETGTTSIETIEISTFPNPAIEQVTISYELDEAQEVKVSILNAQGILIKEVFTGTQEKGINELKVELNNLKSTDFYIVQVETNGKVGTNKILIKK